MACAHVFFLLLSFQLKNVMSQNFEGAICYEKNLNNAQGRCAYIDQCNSAKQDLLHNTKPTLCSFTNNRVLVCCRDGTPQENDRLPDKWANDPRFKEYGPWNDTLFYALTAQDGRLSERKCKEMTEELRREAERIYRETKDDRVNHGIAKCIGIRFIRGGEPAQLNEFPHMAAIGWAKSDGGYAFNCGGSLISPSFVLTAAHCTFDPRALDPNPAIVRLGDHNIDPSFKDEAQPIDLRIKFIHKHPEYRPPKRYNDIALIELERSIDFNINIRPACIWTKDNFLEITKAIASGWGITDDNQPAKVLQMVYLSLLDNEPCDWLLASSRNRNWWGFADSQMCAGELRGGKDTCQGDSGGPLQVRTDWCSHHILGVTSFGHKCAQSWRPAVYTRVASYIDWIESIVWPGET